MDRESYGRKTKTGFHCDIPGSSRPEGMETCSNQRCPRIAAASRPNGLNVKHEPLDEYRVIYFATHALVAGEVEKFAKVRAEPALVLSIPESPNEEDDGLLRASDIALLKMNADFVVLSACNTAAGDKPGLVTSRGAAVHRQTDRAGYDVRRPGGDRN
jgi:hypothetical protein